MKNYPKLLLLVLLSFAAMMQLQAQQDFVADTAAIIDTVEVPAAREESFTNLSTFNFAADSAQLRRVPDSVTNSLKQKNEFWYAAGPIEKKVTPGKQKQEEPFLVKLISQQWFRTLVWIIIIAGFISVLIWYLVDSNASIFQKRSKAFHDDQDGNLDESIFEIDYEKEIDKAIRQANYRLGTRLLFLRLLKHMADNQVIQYKQDRTNLDYLLQLHKTSFYKDFFSLTRHYEYAWYGQFEISPEKFSLLKNDFEQFENKIRPY